MKIGVAYYPEHWPESRWPTDARLMNQMGIDVVRVGNFAWSSLEPRRERFDTDWLEEALEVLADAGLDVILCTPTAAPPPWLFNRHPDMVPVDAEGKPWNMGSRRHACLNHKAYNKYVRRVVTELAKTFGSNPRVSGWQIDSELGTLATGRCYCEHCQQAFRQWLKGRYGSIDRLNRIWGTTFWSQEFTNWYEIPVPRRTPGGPHPSLMLDYSRFISATYREFVNQQVEIIRRYAGEDCIITTNSTGLDVDQIDQFSVGAFQDVAGVDNYPVDEGGLEEAALRLDLARSKMDAPFWVLEQQAGPTALPGRYSQPRPGQLRLWAFQAAARGAELISFLRWRTCPFGQQMQWGGMLDADATPGRRYKELRDTVAEMKGKADLWDGLLPDSSVAIVLDYESHWALLDGSMGMGINYMRHVGELHALLRRMGVQVDFLAPGGDPAPYAAVILPMPFICSAEKTEELEVYVVGGGTLLVTAPAGYRTGANTTAAGLPPGELSDLLGVAVVEHDVLRPAKRNSIRFQGRAGGESCPCSGLCSVMELRGGEALGTYRGEYYAGSPAVTVNRKGEGHAVFMGATGSAEAYRRVLREVMDRAGIEGASWASESVEVIPLGKSPGQDRLFFVLNHAGEPAELPLPEQASCEDLLTQREHTGSLHLEGYGVALVRT